MKEEPAVNDFAWQFSESLAAVVARAAAGVVRVNGRRRRVPSSGVLWSADALVTTNHVLEWDEEIEVGLPDGSTATAQVVGRDPSTDLAVLRFAGAAQTVPEWGGVEEVKSGHLVLELSRPGPRVRSTLGLVSAIGGAWRTPLGGRIDADIQTDLGIHHGFSGSALVDLRGRFLGLNTAGIYRATALVLPAATVRRVADALLAHGSVRRGYLGIVTQPARLPAAAAEAVGQPGALLVTSVQPGSPADQAGLSLGDALLSFAGQPLRQPGDLLPLLEEERIGKPETVRLLRGGDVREVQITPGLRAAQEE